MWKDKDLVNYTSEKNQIKINMLDRGKEWKIERNCCKRNESIRRNGDRVKKVRVQVKSNTNTYLLFVPTCCFTISFFSKSQFPFPVAICHYFSLNYLSSFHALFLYIVSFIGILHFYLLLGYVVLLDLIKCLLAS